jgi:hypothetical protein
MVQKPLTLSVLLSIFFMVSIACTISASPVVQNPDQISTAIARTVEARLTEAAFNSLVVQLTNVANKLNPVTATATPVTPSAVAPSATPVPPSATPLPTFTLLPTFTPLPPTLTPIPCNWAQFVADISIPDNTVLNANQGFTKTWRVRNIGACTWTSDYQVIFSSGNAMSSLASNPLNTTVAPNQTVDISINFVAPNTTGSYIGYWMLRSANGIVFGIGNTANKAFWVSISVNRPTATLNPAIPMNFAESYCYAKWTNNGGSALPCPASTYNYSTGSITKTNAPKLEFDYQDDEPAIITIPADGSGGLISGRYPPIAVQTGDRFRSLVGCLSESPNCNVYFNLKYIANGGGVESLGGWTETYDGNRTYLDVDLNALAGKSVEFILEVQNNNGSSSDDRAFWLLPVILR